MVLFILNRQISLDYGSVGRSVTSVIANYMTKTKRVTAVWYAYNIVISKVYNVVS